MTQADSVAALTGVFRITIVTADQSYPEARQDGFFWLTSGDTTRREPPWLTTDHSPRRTIIGAATWGANASAPRQIDPRAPPLKYFDGSLYDGNYFIDLGSYGKFELRRLDPHSFSGVWHLVMSSSAVIDANGHEYTDPHGSFCATRVAELDSTGGRAKLRIVVTDTGRLRLTNVSVSARELFTHAPAGERRWHGDEAPDSAFFAVAPGTYLLRTDGIGARRETRIVRAVAGSTDLVHFDLTISPWRPSDGPGVVDSSRQEPEFASTIDDAAITAGLPLLRRLPLANGSRAIRFWVGFGRTEPDAMLELVDNANVISGRLLYWWSTSGEFDTLLPGNRDHAVRFAHRIHECRDIRTRDVDATDDHGLIHSVTCATPLMSEARWTRLWSALDSLGVWSLPADSVLIQYGGIVHTDGTSMIVELRDGDRYRSYGYSDPEEQPGGPAVAANQIMRLVLNATRLSLRADPDSAQ